jgi:DNA-binding GntR family transcriptional regulator
VALLAGCNNDHLEAVAQSLRDCSELYRRWYWALADDHHRDIAAEHRRLKELSLDRDADTAVEILTEHIERAPRELIAYAREQGVDSLNRPT